MIIQDKLKLIKKSLPCLKNEHAKIIQLLEKELALSEKKGKPGIGLAAPQIGIYKRVFILRLPNINFNFVNPKIICAYDKTIFENEGCLSFPDIMLRTSRYQEIVIENDIEPFKMVLTGLLAVAFQHELDHLDGILMFDRAI